MLLNGVEVLIFLSFGLSGINSQLCLNCDSGYLFIEK